MPALGVVDAVVKANDPATEAVPPDNVEEVNDWPYVIPVALGTVTIVGVALATVTDTEVVAVL